MRRLLLHHLLLHVVAPREARRLLLRRGGLEDLGRRVAAGALSARGGDLLLDRSVGRAVDISVSSALGLRRGELCRQRDRLIAARLEVARPEVR